MSRIEDLNLEYDLLKTRIKTYANNKNVYFTNPYENAGNITTKCNFHCHTTNSHDGVNSPLDLLNSYKNLNYDLVNISDHSYITPTVSNTPIYHSIGAEPISSIGDYLLINVPADKVAECESIRSLVQYKSLKDVCNTFHKSSDFSGGMVAIAHPNWMGSNEYINANYDFFEISNGKNRETVFNRVLASGKRCFIISDDDSHTLAYSSAPYTQILVSSKSQSNITDALRKGQCYAVVGNSAPILKITWSGKTITVTSSVTADIDFLCGDNGTEEGVVKYTTRSTTATYTIPDDLPYIRVKAYNNKSLSSSNYTLSQVFWRV